MPASFPPDAEAGTVSAELLQIIRARIQRSDGCLPFDAYMEAALYEPGLGYYSNGLVPFGEQGDFITAPESGSLFARCLANCIASVLEQVGQGVVLELGAGSGVLAADLLSALQVLDALPEHYCILERSPAMRALQRETLHDRVPAFIDRVSWLDSLPESPLSGVVFGNEVADALPVRRFRWNPDGVRELGVALGSDGLCECERPADVEFEAQVHRMAGTYQWQGDYRSEYCAALPAWIRSLADSLEHGLLLMTDYGYGRAEYYHPQRSMGTLICHYRHTASADPLRSPGLQDITAFVDFTAMAEAADDAGMQLEGYTSQAQFLIACGIDRLMEAAGADGDTVRFLQLSNEAKRLMLPGEMGDRFKAMGFSRGLGQAVTGFTGQDLRSRL
ncbi:MAG TPA: SAM-dependent methyltransferase [Gammaproteobacteria bacterium]|nr:SAM-dependent methyltransferase [Gammaproteobacteria bacterium]